jgi:cellulose synthase (UDP-forming)
MKRVLGHWRGFGIGSTIAARSVRFITYSVILFLAYECITIDLLWPEQTVLGILTIGLAIAIHKTSDSELVTLSLMFASMLATARYAYWRVVTVSHMFTHPDRPVGWIDLTFMLVLLGAEFYAFVILMLGYIQTIRPLRRAPVPLPENLEEWPNVDVLIPTYNEPLAVVRSTVFASMNIDYPHDKLHVYVLDDGRRDEFRKFCAEAGVGYVTRDNNRHAKAGNINSALEKMTAPFVAIFDCDHVPTRSFLQVTLGWFVKDKTLGMLQTPHFFYSPDPFEKNLDQFNIIPNEGELFYGILQDGNDLWNATFFCGSCAVLRRTALDEIGGIATETVTEDAHTSLRMQTRGWSTAYINIPQAAGLATESLSSHVGQRIRWARGMIQILRTDNPLFVRGLEWAQRLCYFNAMIHFLYAIPRLIFLTAPLVYMLLGRTNIPGHWMAIMAYAMPHLFLSNVTNFRVQGRHRHSFWNEVYETVLAPYILGPTILALVNPKLGKFNVTAKGGIVQEKYFDANIARPYVYLILLNVVALMIAPVRFFLWDSTRPGTVAMNVFWILFNMVIVGTANAVAIEARQLRADVRVPLKLPVEVQLPNGKTIAAESTDISLGGASLKLSSQQILVKGSPLTVVFPLSNGVASLPAVTVDDLKTDKLGIKFSKLTIHEEELLTLVLYSRADTWLARSENRQVDRPFISFLRLVKLSVRGVGYALSTLVPKRKAPAAIPARAAAAILLAAVLLGIGATSVEGASPRRPAGATPKTVAAGSPATLAEGSFQKTVPLSDLGVPEAIQFRGVNASRGVRFALSQSQIVEHAKLNLHYSFSPALISQLSHLNVMLNGTLVSTLPAPSKINETQDSLTATLDLPADLIVRSNLLTFEFVGHYTQSCEDPANSALWARVETNSTLELGGTLLPLADDLKLLPLPFYDSLLATGSATIPFAFLSQPSTAALQVAGIVASWFGVIAKSNVLSFPVTTSPDLPKGNVVLFIENTSQAPAALGLNSGGGPTIAMRSNPGDPYGKVLVIAGDDPSQLLTAARSLALQGGMMQGRTVHISDFQLPPARLADDAPLWMKTDVTSPLLNYANGAELQSDGSGPMPVYLRIPPDLYYGDKRSLPLHVDYRYNAIPIANGSTLRVSANGSLVNELPLPHESAPNKELSEDVTVPLVNMRPFANTFLFNFSFQLAKKGNCQDTAPYNLQGAILKSSYLDLRGLDHWAAMPNLELFANAGFPFSRFADLSQTIVVLPKTASPEETSAYLGLLGYFGGQTGYPALRVRVGDEENLDGDADYLILGSAADQGAFQRLNAQLPVSVRTDGLSVKDTGGFFAMAERAWWRFAELRPTWWWKLGRTQDETGVVASLGDTPDAVIQGIESPWVSNRSIVTISFKDDDAAKKFAAAFVRSSASGDISESVSVLHGTAFSSYRLGIRFYHVGKLAVWSQVRYWLKEFPWLIVVLTFLLGLFVVPWTMARLDRRAKLRLEARQT